MDSGWLVIVMLLFPHSTIVLFKNSTVTACPTFEIDVRICLGIYLHSIVELHSIAHTIIFDNEIIKLYQANTLDSTHYLTDDLTESGSLLSIDIIDS